MNILVTACETFLIPVKVMLYSLSRYHEDLKIYIIYNSLTTQQIKELKQFVNQKCKAQLYPVFAEGYFNKVALSEQYRTSELYFRLLAPYILPQELDRVLYMDADMIINTSLKDFYNQPFKGEYGAVVNNRFIFCDKAAAQKKKHDMKNEDVHINPGFILFNRKHFCENISMDDIMKFIEDHREMLFYFDKAKNRLIGLAEMFEFDKKAGRVEIGYTVNEKYWDNGIAENKTMLMMDFLFHVIGVNSIQAMPMPVNVKSIKVLESSRFIHGSRTIAF